MRIVNDIGSIDSSKIEAAASFGLVTESFSKTIGEFSKISEEGIKSAVKGVNTLSTSGLVTNLAGFYNQFHDLFNNTALTY